MNLDELLAKRAEIDTQIKQARKEERKEAIAKARAIVAQHGLEVKEVFSGRRSKRAGSAGQGKVPPKYRDPATGQTWTGRGKEPVWIRGKNRAAFLI